MRMFPVLSVFVLAACGGNPPKSSSVDTPSGPVEETAKASAKSAEPTSWSDWKTYTNVSPGPWVSKTHGKRFVEIYVNDIALEAYKTPDAPLPVGSIVVKPSWTNTDGKPGESGPLFIMEKMPEGFAPDSEDWFYGFQWPNAPKKWLEPDGSTPDWRSPSKKIEYCSNCHDYLDRGLGMPPKERNWMAAPEVGNEEGS